MRPSLEAACAAAVAFLIGASAAVYGLTEARVRTVIAVDEPAPPPLPDAPSALERGRHLARDLARCVACHGDDLAGRRVPPRGLVGRAPDRVHAPNLTRGRGGIGGALTVGQWARAIRHGVGRDGRALWLMPAARYHGMSDDDLGALVAYLRRLPPVDRVLPANRLGPVSRTLYLARRLPLLEAELLDHARRAPPRVAPRASWAYGAYLARLGGCASCHAPGAADGGAARGPRDYDAAQLARALREGRRPDGTRTAGCEALDAPRHLDGDEVRALHAYLRADAARR